MQPAIDQWCLKFRKYTKFIIEIQGNETADKAATNLQMPSDLKMNTCDFKSKKKAYQWDQAIGQLGKINENKQPVRC
jgi:hypothetical protein